MCELRVFDLLVDVHFFVGLYALQGAKKRTSSETVTEKTSEFFATHMLLRSGDKIRKTARTV